MSRIKILTRPTSADDLSIDSMDEFDRDIINHDWEEKSRNLQARRWRKLMQSGKESKILNKNKRKYGHYIYT